MLLAAGLAVFGSLFLPSEAKAITANYPGTVNFTLSSANPKLGDQLTITITRSPSAVKNGGSGFYAEIYACGDPAASTCDYNRPFAKQNFGTGETWTTTITVGPSFFRVGDNLIKAKMQWADTVDLGDGNAMRNEYNYWGDKILNVGAATGGPSISASQSSSRLASSGIIAVLFNISLTGTTRVPTGYTISCGSPTPGALHIQSPNSTTFECWYPSGAATFTGTISASDAAGTIAGPSNFTATLTGNENVGGANPGNEQDKGSWFTGIIALIVGILTGIIRGFLYLIYSLIILPMIKSAAIIHVGQGSCAAGANPGFLGVVCPGWTYVRNLVNMLFILVLIVIGLATILRVQAYNYKTLLVKLILMAVLVNFSLVIAQAILTIADVAQNTFISSSGDDFLAMGKNLIYRNYFLGGNGWQGWWDTLTGGGAGAQSGISLLVSQLVDLCMAFLSFMIMGAVAVFLVIRLVALWILLILSPFAYALFILPQTKGLASTWWRNFIKYAFFTPIMFFFLKMAVYLDGYRLQLLQVADPCATGGVASCGISSQFVYNLVQQLLVLGFVLAGLLVARKLAIFGAGALVGAATTAAMLPVKKGWAGTKWAGKKAGGRVAQGYNQWTATKIRGSADKVTFGRGLAYAAMNPVAFFRGWGQRAEENKKRASEYAALGGREVVEQMWSGGKKVVPRRSRHAERETDEHVKDFSQQTVDQMVSNINRIAGLANEGAGGGEKLDNLAIQRAGVMALFGSGRIDDATMGARGTLKEKMEAEGKKMGMSEADLEKYKDHEGNFAYDTTGLTRQLFYRAMFGENKEAIKMVAEQGEIAGKATEHYEYMKDGTFNPAANKGNGEHEYSGKWVRERKKEDGTVEAAHFENERGDDRYKNEISKMTAGKLAGESWISARGINMKLKKVTDKVTGKVTLEPDIDEVGLRGHFAGLKQRAFQAQDRNAAGLFYGKNTVDRDKVWGNGDLHALKYGKDDINYEYAKKIGEMDPVAAAIYHEKLTTGKAIDAKTATDKAAKGFDIVRVDANNIEIEGTRHTIKSKEGVGEGEPHYKAASKAVDSGSMAGEHKEHVAQALKSTADDAHGEIPQMDRLVHAIESLPTPTGANKTQVAGIAQNYLEELVDKKAGKVDYVGGLAAMSPDLLTKLAPQEFGKLQAAVAEGVKNGLKNGANLANSDQKSMAFHGEVATAINKIADELPRVSELKDANKVNDLAARYYSQAKETS